MNKIFRKAIVLTLAGSALLYTGCTKDYSGDITDLQEKYTELQNSTSEQFASLRNQIGDLQQLVAKLDAAKAEHKKMIEDLQNRATALETFKTNAEEKFASLDNQISGINGQISAINGKLTEIDGQIAAINANITALQQADEKLNQAIEAAKTRIKALEDNTYTKQEVDGKIASVKEWANEIFATKETVAQIQEALGTLAGTVDVINGRLTAVETTLGELQNTVAAQGQAIEGLQGAVDSINDEIFGIKQDISGLKTDLAAVKQTAETAAQNASQALTETEAIRQDLLNNYYKKAEVDARIKALKDAVDAELTELKAADVKLNERIDSLAGVTKNIEEAFAAYVEQATEKFNALEEKINEEIQNRIDFQSAQEAKNEALDAKDAEIEADLNDKYLEIMGEISEINDALDDIYGELSWVWLFINNAYDWLYALNERIQSVVFVPHYTDLCADLTKITLADEPLKNIVSAEFEVQPSYCIDYIDSLIKTNQIGLAVKELESRTVDADAIIYDVNVSIVDEERGRFVVEAFLDPEVFDEEVAISCVLGDYEVEGVEADNGLQSTYVLAKEVARVDLTDTYVWYDEAAGVALDDSLGVGLRIPYTEPAEDSLVFNAVSENIAFRMNIEGVCRTLAEVAEALFLDVDVLTPQGQVDYWWTKDATDTEVADNDPFELSEFAPETSLTTTKNADGVVDPQYVHFTTGRKEVFVVNGATIAPYAFVGVEITKNQVPAFATDTYEIPWSYVHPEATNGKSFEVDGATDFGKAIEGTYSNADENFTKDDEVYERDPQVESVEFIPADATNQTAGLVRFNGWAFEAEDVNYVAKTERFETESDDYEIDVPFVLKKRAANRAVVIDLGELSTYRPSVDLTVPVEAIVPAFNGQEEYFIGDAEDPYNCTDSLYSAYANEGSAYHTPGNSFTIDAIYVNGDFENKINEYGPYINFNLAWDVVNSADASALSILAGKVPYGATVDVCGAYTEFGVLFDYVITFTTPECPYTLVLTPYDKFDPAKDRTIIVEGDDIIDPNLYTLQQMFYSKYLRVVDQEAYKQGLFQKPAAADIDGADLQVKFTYSYEDLAEFGANATEADRGEVVGADQVTVITDVAADYGYLDFAQLLTWGTYNGLKVTVTAELIENGVSIQTLEDFYIETEKPIALLEAGVIGADEPLQRVSGNPLEVIVAQKMVIGGVLSRGENNSKYYVADPAVFGYMDNNVDQLTGDLCDFYQLDVIYDWANITATLNGVEWELHQNVDYTTDVTKLILLADSAKGTIVLNVPVSIRYYLDYCGAKAVDSGVITIYINQI